MTEPKDDSAVDGTDPASTAMRPPIDETSIGAAKSGAKNASPNDVGAALRNAFRATVDEDIPDEMLDLLRRLD